MLGPPPLLPTFTAGRAFKPGGGTSGFPCLHGHQVWHTGQVPVVPGRMEMTAGFLGFLRQLWTGLRGGALSTAAGGRGRDVRIHSRLLCKVLVGGGCFCQVIHLNPGEGTDGTLGWGWCPLEGSQKRLTV